MKKFLLVSVMTMMSLLLLNKVELSQKTNISSYPFSREIVLPKLNRMKSMVLNLNSESLRKINERFSNVSIYDLDKNRQEFDVYFKNSHIVKFPKVVEVSSYLKGDVKNIVDGNAVTDFHFDKKTDGKNPAWVLIDFGELKNIGRIDVWSPFDATIRDIEVQGGRDPYSLKTILPRRTLKISNNVSSKDLVRYVKVMFYGHKVEISNLRFWASRVGKIYFSADQNSDLQLVYGGNKNVVDYLDYTERYGEIKNTEVEARLSKIENWNSIFPKDFDQDGIENKSYSITNDEGDSEFFAGDNCPFVKNKRQNDYDEDGIGDDCDNSKKNKNTNQSDIDFDGIGDVEDNCKFVGNPNQKDSNNNKIGNACDLQPYLGATNWKQIFMIIAGILVLGVIIFFSKFKKNKK